jgi:SecD/SecF fusion protein
MSMARKFVLGLALIALLVVALAFGWQLYRQWARPNLARAGGTVLVYEVDRERTRGDFNAENLAVELRRRLDPAEIYGIGVRPLPGDRIEVSLPRSGGDHTREVAAVRDLIARGGTLEFRILANTDDDAEGIDQAANKPVELEQQKPAAGKSAYSWIELGPQQRIVYGLDNRTGETVDEGSFWQEMAEARKTHKAVLHTDANGGLYRTNLFYSREIVNPDRLPEKDRGKKYEYYILCRGEEEGRAVTGALLESAEPGTDPEQKRPAVNFHFNAEGTTRLADLTKKNTGRQMALILDDVIQSAPKIKDPITGGRGIITGNFTQEEVDHMVNILRAGALPATLKPEPVSEITVEPTK